MPMWYQDERFGLLEYCHLSKLQAKAHSDNAS